MDVYLSIAFHSDIETLNEFLHAFVRPSHATISSRFVRSSAMTCSPLRRAQIPTLVDSAEPFFFLPRFFDERFLDGFFRFLGALFFENLEDLLCDLVRLSVNHLINPKFFRPPGWSRSRIKSLSFLRLLPVSVIMSELLGW